MEFLEIFQSTPNASAHCNAAVSFKLASPSPPPTPLSPSPLSSTLYSKFTPKLMSRPLTSPHETLKVCKVVQSVTNDAGDETRNQTSSSDAVPCHVADVVVIVTVTNIIVIVKPHVTLIISQVTPNTIFRSANIITNKLAHTAPSLDGVLST